MSAADRRGLSAAERPDQSGPDPSAEAPGAASVRRAGLDDATLVARAKDGDPAAFEALVTRYQPPIFRLALRMLADRGEAEDVTQEVFVTAWRRLPEIRAEAAFGGWLYRTATNRCLNVIRGRRPTSELEPETVVDPYRGRRPEDAAETSAAVAALERALQTLTPEQRACWLLREAHGRSYEEIAVVVDGTPTAVRGRIARARAQLAEVMTPWR